MERMKYPLSHEWHAAINQHQDAQRTAGKYWSEASFMYEAKAMADEVPRMVMLEKIARCTPDDIDTAKAWTCAAHIVSEGGDIMNEGYLLRVDDRMFWDNLYASLAQEG
ncbi:MAG: hypothetical protein EBS50_08700 [Sphingomonadaceae bacterium]|nr:hypothetical protein [Sphingomonadaceae bacterium]